MGGQGGRRGTCHVLCAVLLGAIGLGGVPPVARAQISVGDVQATEDAGSMTFTITRRAALLAGATTVSFATADGSAGAPADYGATSGTRAFAGSLFGGTQSQQVAVTLAADALDEPEETLRLVISGAEVTDGEAVGTILDDDVAPAVGVVDAPAAGEGATAAFAIGLSRPSGRAVSVAYATADGSAVAGQDYSARSGRVTIAAGATSAAVGVPISDDSDAEPSETFELRLSAPTAVTLADAAGTATIVDDDGPAPAGAAAPASGSGPSAGSGPPPVGPASGTTANSALPRLGVSAPRLRQPATVLVTISCPRQSGRCRGRLTIFSRPYRRSKIKTLRSERRLGRRNFNLPGGGSQTLLVALSRRDRVLLKRAGRMSVRAYVVTTDGAGRAGVRWVNGTLVARTSHSG